MISEWTFLRAFGCMSIVWLHSMLFIGKASGWETFEPFQIFRALLTFATPAFIVLSEIILANRYPEKLPALFFRKRILFILLPFCFFALLDVVTSIHLYGNVRYFLPQLLDNLLGNFSGWFILVIFQFYALHYFFIKWKVSIKKIWLPSVVVMYVYLFLLQSDLPFWSEHRSHLKIPFLAWIGYFTTAYGIGKHYRKVAQFCASYKWLLLFATFLSGLAVFVFYQLGYTLISSRRFDLFPFVILLCLTVIAWGQNKTPDRFVNLINSFSFGVYLLHWQIQKLTVSFFVALSPYVLVNQVLLFFGSLLICLVVLKLCSFSSYSFYFVGKIPVSRLDFSFLQRKSYTVRFKPFFVKGKQL